MLLLLLLLMMMMSNGMKYGMHRGASCSELRVDGDLTAMTILYGTDRSAACSTLM